MHWLSKLSECYDALLSSELRNSGRLFQVCIVEIKKTITELKLTSIETQLKKFTRDMNFRHKGQGIYSVQNYSSNINCSFFLSRYTKYVALYRVR